MSSEHPEALRLAAQLEDTESARLHLLPYAAAALRNLHTENTALRVTEDNLRQELQECQEQRRAAFRRIEELEALRAQIGHGVPDGWRIEHVSDGDIRLYGPKNIWPGMGETWLIQSGHDGFYGFLHRFFTAMLASAPQAPQQKPLTDERTKAILFDHAISNGLLTVHSERMNSHDPATRCSWLEGHAKACDISNEAAHGIGEKR